MGQEGKTVVGALRKNRRDTPGQRTSSFAVPSTSVVNEDVKEIEDRAIDAMSGSAASDMVGLWKMAENLSVGPNLEKLIKAWLGFLPKVYKSRQTNFPDLMKN